MHEPNLNLLDDLLEQMPQSSDAEFASLSRQFIKEIDPSWKPSSGFGRLVRVFLLWMKGMT